MKKKKSPSLHFFSRDTPLWISQQHLCNFLASDPSIIPCDIRTCKNRR